MGGAGAYMYNIIMNKPLLHAPPYGHSSTSHGAIMAHYIWDSFHQIANHSPVHDPFANSDSDEEEQGGADDTKFERSHRMLLKVR